MDGKPQEGKDVGRREFLGNAAVAAAAAVGAPALLAACSADGASAPTATTTPDEGPRRSHQGGDQPWWTLHHKIAATIGAASNVRVPALERTDNGYVQQVVTDDDRTGTGLATILLPLHRFPTAGGGYTSVSVRVVNSRGARWPARTIEKQGDLVYAMKDALASNTLADGVLRESLTPGKPVVAIIKASVIQFADSVASDYYGNHLQVSSRAFCDIFNPNVAGYPLASTTRDFTQC